MINLTHTMLLTVTLTGNFSGTIVLNSTSGTILTLAPFFKGAEGDSAYQVWLDAGNAGTEDDFLTDIGSSVYNLYDIVPTSSTFVCQNSPGIFNLITNKTHLENRLRISAFGFTRDISVVSVGVRVVTAVASAKGRAVVYELTATDTLTLILESDEIAIDATGHQSVLHNLTFEAGKLYFAGFVSNLAGSKMSAIPEQGTYSIGMTSPTQIASSSTRQVNANAYGTTIPTTVVLSSLTTGKEPIAIIMEVA